MHTNFNQPVNNTMGFGNLPLSAFPLPLWQYMAYNTNLGYGNYNALTVSAKKRLAKGVPFQASYIFARNLSNVDGAAATTADQFAGEYGGFVSDPPPPSFPYRTGSFSLPNRS